VDAGGWTSRRGWGHDERPQRKGLARWYMRGSMQKLEASDWNDILKVPSGHSWSSADVWSYRGPSYKQASEMKPKFMTYISNLSCPSLSNTLTIIGHVSVSD
jgi:hypothetical protein